MADLQVNDQGDGVIALIGNLNRKTVVSVWPNYQQVLDELKQKNIAVTLDLGAVDHVDTAGLAWLLNVFAERQKIDQKIAMQNTPMSLLKLAKISNVESILPLQ
jgi:phospholipid transport system transporter-binding protein